MKSILVLLTVLFLMFNGCVYDPPGTAYFFVIENKSTIPVVLTYKSNKEIESRGKCDTILPRQTDTLIFPVDHYFKDFKDTLIGHFFNSISINSFRLTLVKDPLIRNNWKEKKELNYGFLRKGGIVYYNFTIINDDIP